MDKNILITTAPFGNGHKMVATAIKNAFIKKGYNNVVVVDLFTETHPKITEAIKKAYIRSYDFGKAYSKLYYGSEKLTDKKVVEDEDESKKQFGLGPVITTALTFFLGEMGDKTQLTCMTLSMDAHYPSVVLAGSVTAMLAIGLAGIIIGTSLTKFIPSYIIKTISGLIFIIFGVVRMII